MVIINLDKPLTLAITNITTYNSKNRRIDTTKNDTNP